MEWEAIVQKTNSEKAKAASECKGGNSRVRRGSGCIEQAQAGEEGGWRLGMEGKRSKEPMGQSE
jgi:hypothetical protein